MATPATETLLARVTSGRRAKRMVAILDLISLNGSVSSRRPLGQLVDLTRDRAP